MSRPDKLVIRAHLDVNRSDCPFLFDLLSRAPDARTRTRVVLRLINEGTRLSNVRAGHVAKVDEAAAAQINSVLVSTALVPPDARIQVELHHVVDTFVWAPQWEAATAGASALRRRIQYLDLAERSAASIFGADVAGPVRTFRAEHADHPAPDRAITPPPTATHPSPDARPTPPHRRRTHSEVDPAVAERLLEML